MKSPMILFTCAMLTTGTITQGAPQIAVTDGNSLVEGLRLFHLTDRKRLSLEENVAAFGAANFVHGFYAGCTTWNHQGTDSPFAIPPEVNPVQFQKTMEKWLADHPERLHEHAGALLMRAVCDAWPNPAFKKPVFRKAP